MLIDNHGRQINYLRLAVTDNCNLRCRYCMPEEGVSFAHKEELLSWKEMEFLSSIFVAMGIDKVRITGGEPFVRKGLMEFLEKLAAMPEVKEISITTNATLIAPHIQRLKQLGITKINVSFDSLDKGRFHEITRRDQFDTVMANIQQMMNEGFDVKLNCVVMDGRNTQDILPMVRFTQENPITVRFLEEMPFNGQSAGGGTLKWDYITILEHIKAEFGHIEQLPAAPSSTSLTYKIQGAKGSLGIIPSYSRTFCGTCNRVRVTARGEMQTCLYASESTDLRELIRNNGSEEGLKFSIRTALGTRHKDGFEAENQSITKRSMTLIGG